MQKTVKFLMAVLLCCSCTRDPGYVAINGYAQGGTYTVKYNARQCGIRPEAVRSGIDSILTLIDTTLSGYNPISALSRLSSGRAIRPNPLFKEMYRISRELWEETGGALDVAAGPLFDAWGFGFSHDSLPDGKTVDSLMAVCGMKLLPGELPELFDPAQHGHPKLNFNAIAQGYSCDLVAAYLRENGVKDMLVDIGEMFCDGLNPSGQPWTVGIDKPDFSGAPKGQSLQGIMTTDGGPCGLVTSGNYRRFYIKDGKRYAHTIDPRTGYPVSHNLLSATIVAPNATLADAYATYCMVIGPDASREFILSREDLEGYLICAEGDSLTAWSSPGLHLK